MNVFVEYLEPVAHWVDLIGIAIVLFGFIQSLILMAKFKFKAYEFFDWTSRIRCRLGTYILLGLEFMIASDLIMTAIKPMMESLVLVAVLVVIRTAIAFFLGKELQQLKNE